MATKKKNTEKATSQKVVSKSSVKEMEQAHGRLDDMAQSAVAASQRLDKILGMRRKSPFGTRDEEEFARILSTSTEADLRELCAKAGVFPSGDKPALKNKLIKAFGSWKRGTNLAAIPMNNTQRPSSAVQSKIDAIWNKK
jgi:hypothetical protein